MSKRILLAPVGSGKTEYVLTHLADTLTHTPFAKVWAVLATKRQEDAFRQRLAEWDNNRDVFFNVEFFNFYELYQRILDRQGFPYRLISEHSRLRILREVITDVESSLKVFHTIVDKPGFLRITADFVAELKQNEINPYLLAKAAQNSKDVDLSIIYTAYQHYNNQYDLVDQEGQGWLAVKAMREDENLVADLNLLIVDGFDQFTPVQANLLALLAERTDDTLFTLTAVQGREDTIGRRFARAFDRLNERFDRTLEVVALSDVAQDNRHPDLRHLIDNVFRHNAPSKSSEGGIRFVETPDPASEVSEVLRRVKRLLLEGISPDEILIVLRDWERYSLHFSLLGRKYGLPLALHYGEPLQDNPATVALTTLLELSANDFRRRDLLDVLRSPYFDAPNLDSDDFDVLERLSQQWIVTSGREKWLDMLANRYLPLVNEDESRDDDAQIVDETMRIRLQAGLTRFFEAITPPEYGTVAQYVQWIDDLIGHDPVLDRDDDSAELEIAYSLNVIACIRDESASDRLTARDLAAMKGFKQVLRGLLMTQDLISSLDGVDDIVMTWSAFFHDLQTAIGTTTINPRPGRAGQALVTTATDARGLPHDYVFVLGMSEGLFPAQTPQDPLYLDSERRVLQAHGIFLETQAERKADDGLFYELICLPRKSLTLSRPTTRDGTLWIESPLWRAAKDIFDDGETLIQRERVAIGQVATLDSAASLDEAGVALAAALTMGASADEQRALKWLQVHSSPYWKNIYDGRRIEINRLSPGKFDRYSGRLQDERLVATVARELNADRTWSASQLNDYGVCGFRFFAKRLLMLGELQEPDEGMDVLQRGTLFHAILEHTYRALSQRKIVIAPDNLDLALAIAREIADVVFSEAPEQIGFRVDALWEQEQATIWRRIEQLIKADFAAGNDSPLNKKFGEGRLPIVLEAGFGDDGDVTLDLGDGVGVIKVRGYIDRIDQWGGRAIIVDYKSGSTRIPITEMEEGRNFQMMTYLEGAKSILRRTADGGAPLEIAGGAFWHITNRSLSGDVQMDREDHRQAIEIARQRLGNNIALGRRGDFAVHATKMDNNRCIRYCEYHQLCRVSLTNHRKR